eukprot:468274_1
MEVQELGNVHEIPDFHGKNSDCSLVMIEMNKSRYKDGKFTSIVWNEATNTLFTEGIPREELCIDGYEAQFLGCTCGTKKKKKKIDGITITQELSANSYACCDKSNDSTFIDDLVCVWEGDDDMQFQWYTVGYDNGNGHAKIVEGVQYLCCDEDSKRK